MMANINRVIRGVGSAVSGVARGTGRAARKVKRGTGALLKTALSAVDAVVNVLTRQQNVLEEQVEGTIQSIIAQVTGGVWIGAGADAFVQELQTEFLPVSQSLDNSIGRMIQGVRSAQKLVEEADNKATQVVDSFVEIVDSIF
jgi:uncharacterized protein YukE